MPDEFVPMVGNVTDEDKRIAFANSPGRIFAIGDIHGRYDLLMQLLEALTFGPAELDFKKDKLIFLGDMIDRGTESRSVIREIQSLIAQCPGQVIALAGNHDDMLVKLACEMELKGRFKHRFDKRNMDNLSWWLINGGGETLDSYACRELAESPSYGRVTFYYEVNDEIKEAAKWIASLPTFHEEPGFFFSHAPVPRENRRGYAEKGKAFTRHELTWTYDKDEFGVSRNHGNGVTGVCGHIHKLADGIMAPRFYDHYIFADAGCGCSSSAPLVAIEVKSRQVYYSWPKDLK